MIVGNISDMLARGVAARVMASVRHEVRIGDLVLLFVLHDVFHHCIMTAERNDMFN